MYTLRKQWRSVKQTMTRLCLCETATKLVYSNALSVFSIPTALLEMQMIKKDETTGKCSNNKLEFTNY